MDLLTSGLGEALRQLADPVLLLFFLLGTLNGMLFGLLPGLSGSVGIALMIPLTYGISLNQALTLFVAAMSGQTFAGSIGAILINMPGTAPNAATTFDGYPLTRRGRGGFAIGISAMSSAMGSLIGCVVLVVLLPVVRATILAFGYPEFTLLGVVGLAAIAMASRGTLLKGLASGAFGVLLSLVGFSPIGNQLRYIFGFRLLWGGIDLVPVLIGVFALSEVMRLLLRRQTVVERPTADMLERSQVFEGMRYVFTQPFLLIRSALVGTFLGIVPGVGGTVASFLAYFQAKKTSKDNTFGDGDPRGVLAPETANDAKDAGSALPSLGFGLPGSSDWAIILGAMILHGVAPGPTLIRENPETIWITIVVILIASWVTSAIGVAAAPWLVRLTGLRGSVIGPVVAALAITGSFAVQQQELDVFFAVVAAIIGYYMVQNRVPLVPLILGLILGGPVESWFLRSMSLYDSGILIFVQRPISLVLVIGLVLLFVSEIFAWRSRRAAARAEVGDLSSVLVRANRSGLVLFGLWAVLGAGAALMATGFQEPAALFPQLSGWFLFATSGLYVLVAAVPALRSRFWPLIIDPANAEVRRPAEEAPRPPADAAPTPEAEPGGGRTATALAERVLLEQPQLVSRRREYALIGVLVGLAFAVWVIGLAVTIPVFLWLVMRRFGDESLRTTAVTLLVTLVTLYLLFGYLIGLPLTFGMFG